MCLSVVSLSLSLSFVFECLSVSLLLLYLPSFCLVVVLSCFCRLSIVLSFCLLPSIFLHLSMSLSIYISMYPSISVSMCLLISLSVDLSIFNLYLLVHFLLSLCLYVYSHMNTLAPSLSLLLSLTLLFLALVFSRFTELHGYTSWASGRLRPSLRCGGLVDPSSQDLTSKSCKNSAKGPYVAYFWGPGTRISPRGSQNQNVRLEPI